MSRLIIQYLLMSRGGCDRGNGLISIEKRYRGYDVKDR